jgi:hypothetical protein
LFDAVAKNAGTRDVYRMLRASGMQLAVPTTDAIASVERLRRRLVEHPEWGAEHPVYAEQTSTEKVDDAVRGLSTYHTRPIVERVGDTLYVRDVKLLFYYQNRTAQIPPEASS